MSDFEIVKDFVPGGASGTRGNPHPRVLAVMAGETIFLPWRQDSVQRRFESARRRGYRVHTHKGERNGVQGVYVWAEKNDEHP